MLTRAALPLLRPRNFHAPVRLAVSSWRSQSRSYAQDRRPDGYRVPTSAEKRSWPQQIDPEKTAVPPISEYTARRNARLQRNTPEELPETQSEHDLQTPNAQQSIPDDINHSAPMPDPSQPEQSSSTPRDPVQPADEVEGELNKPLPDLTQGIPSTLEAELSQRSGGVHASRASLNITEDPSEPTAAGGGRGGDGLPRTSYISSSDRKRNNAVLVAYVVIAGGIVGYTLWLGRNWANEEEAAQYPDAPPGWGMGLFYKRVKARLGAQLAYYKEPPTKTLLPDEDKDPNLRYPFTLVLSLEDLLIHNEWTRKDGWRVAKRPGLDYFLLYLSQYYEIVLFTSQPFGVVDPVLRKLDPFSVIRFPLFREATLYKDGKYIKDLSYLNRPLNRVLMIDTDPHHVSHQPENAIVLPPWTGDPTDTTLVDLIPFLEYLAAMGFTDTRAVLKSFEGKNIPVEFARREKLLREKFEAQEAARRGGKPAGKKSSSGFGGLFSTKTPQPPDSPDSVGGGTEGKMIWDQIREAGQRNYLLQKKQIDEEGWKWLQEREAEEKRMQEEAVKSMKSGFTSWFTGGSKKDEPKVEGT